MPHNLDLSIKAADAANRKNMVGKHRTKRRSSEKALTLRLTMTLYNS